MKELRSGDGMVRIGLMETMEARSGDAMRKLVAQGGISGGCQFHIEAADFQTGEGDVGTRRKEAERWEVTSKIEVKGGVVGSKEAPGVGEKAS